MVMLTFDVKSKMNDGLSPFPCNMCGVRIGAGTSSVLTFSVQFRSLSVMCCRCFAHFRQNTQLALHLAARK